MNRYIAIAGIVAVIGILMLSIFGSDNTLTGKGVALRIPQETLKKVAEKESPEIPQEMLKKVAEKVKAPEPQKYYACYDSEFQCKIVTAEMDADKGWYISTGLSRFDCILIHQIVDLRKELNLPTDTSDLNLFTGLCREFGWYD